MEFREPLLITAFLSMGTIAPSAPNYSHIDIHGFSFVKTVNTDSKEHKIIEINDSYTYIDNYIVNSSSDIKYIALHEKIAKFKNFAKSDWFKDIPSQTSIEISQAILRIFYGINKVPENISVSSEGSIVFNFFNGDTYNVIEVYNTSEIVYLKRPEGEESVAYEVSYEVLKSKLYEDFNEGGENLLSEMVYGE
jgi:hypothetical protein